MARNEQARIVLAVLIRQHREKTNLSLVLVLAGIEEARASVGVEKKKSAVDK